MSVQGIEFADDSKVALATIRDAGLAFVVGHLGTGPTGYLTAARARDYIDAGLSIVSVFDAPPQPTDGGAIGYDPGLFEDPASVLQGIVYRAGVTDATSAFALAKSVGQAAGSAIYFDVNADVNVGISYVLDYFRGIALGLAQASMGDPAYTVGVHGSGYVLDAVYGAGLAGYKWLAAPPQWQGSAGYATYDILEYGTADDPRFPDVVVSHDATSDAKPGGDFGQWGVSVSAANLVINDLSIRTLPLSAGDQATITFAIGNAGTATAPASTARLFLSRDATITAEDLVLGTFDLPSLAARTATTDSLIWVVPGDISAGTYYLGVAADPVPGESSASDNVFATRFAVVAASLVSTNLVVNDLSLGAASVAVGKAQTINFAIGNAGLSVAAGTSATLYLSSDATITAADLFLGAFPIPSLSPGAASAKSLSMTIPAGTAEGTYYIGVVASPVAGETNTNDNTYAVRFAVTAEPAPQPNLVINNLTLGAASLAAGGTAAIDFAIGNAGSASAPASTATLYLSSDADITASDLVLGRLDIPALAAGAAAPGQLTPTIPAGTAAGTYFIGVMVDAVPGEPNIHDNGFAQSVAITRTAGSVSIADVSVSEGNSGTILASFVVTRTGGTEAFDIAFTTADGGATLADGDYLATSGTLTFGENVVAQTITVTINGDLADETLSAQTFFVNLSGATAGAALADAQGQGLIIDDDRRNRLPEVTGRDLRVHAAQRAAGASIILSVADADGDAITEYAFRDSIAGGGYLLADGVAREAGGWTTIAAADLGTLSYVGGSGEGAEPIDVRVFDGQGWSPISQVTATTIADIDDDYASTPATSGRIATGGSITGSIETPADADWLAIPVIAGRTYQFDLEGSATGEGTLTDPVLELRDHSGSSVALATDDNGGTGGNARLVYTATETDTLFVSAGGAGTSTGTYKLTAAVRPTASLAITALDARKPEGRSGTTSFTFTVTRSGDLGLPCTARYAVTGSGRQPAFATDFADGVFPSAELAFAPGEASRIIAIPVAGDAITEDSEGFTVTLTSPSRDVVVETASADGLIRDDDTITDLVVVNTATSQPVLTTPWFYDGPVAGLEKEIILITPDNLSAAVSGDNWFIRTGSGTDALAAHGGRNVLDGGGGSNFLTGASGEDTFFLDARGASADIWSTVVGFGRGDSVTVWGISPAQATITWADDLGATGYSGLTLQASAAGRPNALVTLVGFSRADLDNGRLLVTPGAIDPASPYLHIYQAV